MDKNIINFSNKKILEKVSLESDDFNEDNFLNNIEQHGVVILRNVLNKKNLTNLLDEYKKAYNIKNSPYICPQGVNAPPNVSNLYPDFINDNYILQILRDLKISKFGKEIYNFFNDKYFTCKKAVMSTHRTKPTNQPFQYMNWHQDNASMGWPEDIKALTVWCPLTSTGPEDAPGLRLCGNKFEKNIISYTGDTKKWSNVLEKYLDKIILPKTEIGDCIIFDNFTMHGTGFTLSQVNTRYSLDFRLLSLSKHPTLTDQEKIFVYPFKNPELYKNRNSLFKKIIKKILK